MSRRARIQAAATALCLLCALLAGGTGAIAALAQTHGQAPARALAQGSAKQGHATKRSGCARQKRRHAKRAKRCHSRHAASKTTKPITPAPLAPAALLSVPAVVAPPAPLPLPVASSPAPATTPSEAPPSEAPPSEAPGEVEPRSVPHVQVSAVEYSFTLSRTSVPAGKVILQFVNDGQDEHNLHITEGEEGPLVGSFADTPSKGVGQLQLEMRSGSYTLLCSLHGHEAKGMKATLTVE
jgi:plastocyanin